MAPWSAATARAVRLQLRRLALEGVVRPTHLVRQQDREQLGRVADPLAEHPEIARADGVVVDQPHPVEPARPVRRVVERRIGDRVVEGHPVDGRHADGAGDRHDLGPGPVREGVVVADGGQPEVGAVVGHAEDQARTGAARRDAGDVGELRRAQPDSMR